MRLLLLLLIAVPASAVDLEREEYAVVGWDNACGVAVERYAYPVLGQAIHGEPIMSRVGTISVILKTSVVQTHWFYEASGTNTWDEKAIARTRRKLVKIGFDRPGYAERIRLDAPTSDAAGTREVIFSTSSLDARPAEWPGAEWRWGRAHYNPLGTCALLVYEKAGERDRFKFVLTRIYNASARTDRARAHTTNGRNLFEKGDLDGALAETKTGAELAPELAGTRYQYAAMLALSGQDDEAMEELEAAVEKDKKYGPKAGEDQDFDSLRPRQDFRDLVKGSP